MKSINTKTTPLKNRYHKTYDSDSDSFEDCEIVEDEINNNEKEKTQSYEDMIKSQLKDNESLDIEPFSLDKKSTIKSEKSKSLKKKVSIIEDTTDHGTSAKSTPVYYDEDTNNYKHTKPILKNSLKLRELSKIKEINEDIDDSNKNIGRMSHENKINCHKSYANDCTKSLGRKTTFDFDFNLDGYSYRKKSKNIITKSYQKQKLSMQHGEYAFLKPEKLSFVSSHFDNNSLIGNNEGNDNLSLKKNKTSFDINPLNVHKKSSILSKLQNSYNNRKKSMDLQKQIAEYKIEDDEDFQL